jgi:hypothetical protein
MLRSDKTELGADSVHPVEKMSAAPVPAVIPTSQLSDKHEAFVQELMRNGGRLCDAYRAVYPNAGSRNAVLAHSTRLRARRDVSERIDELTRLAAQTAVIDASVLLQELYEICTASPEEIVRVVVRPCSSCWPADGLALAAVLDRGETPDSDAPRDDCAACRGRGIQDVHITDTSKLSGPARRLYQGAEVTSSGAIKVRMIDQLAARKELAELLGMKVSRSESKSLNVNMNVPASTAVSAEDVLREFHALRDVTPR